jgi:hypothetical protein
LEGYTCAIQNSEPVCKELCSDTEKILGSYDLPSKTHTLAPKPNSKIQNVVNIHSKISPQTTYCTKIGLNEIVAPGTNCDIEQSSVICSGNQIAQCACIYLKIIILGVDTISGNVANYVYRDCPSGTVCSLKDGYVDCVLACISSTSNTEVAMPGSEVHGTSTSRKQTRVLETSVEYYSSVLDGYPIPSKTIEEPSLYNIVSETAHSSPMPSMPSLCELKNPNMTGTPCDVNYSPVICSGSSLAQCACTITFNLVDDDAGLNAVYMELKCQEGSLCSMENGFAICVVSHCSGNGDMTMTSDIGTFETNVAQSESISNTEIEIQFNSVEVETMVIETGTLTIETTAPQSIDPHANTNEPPTKCRTVVEIDLCPSQNGVIPSGTGCELGSLTTCSGRQLANCKSNFKI